MSEGTFSHVAAQFSTHFKSTYTLVWYGITDNGNKFTTIIFSFELSGKGSDMILILKVPSHLSQTTVQLSLLFFRENET